MSFSRDQIATGIALLFHFIGLVGILLVNKDLFVHATFYNLLLMFFLILYTQEKVTPSFIVFIICCIITGIGVEIIGTRTGLLFGSYAYGDTLGPLIMDVPVIIGLNWFIIIYCCGICVAMMLRKLTTQLPEGAPVPRRGLQKASMIIDGAMLAVLFDWILEPVAVKLGYWTWTSGEIPMYNYICWFLVSAFLLMIFQFCRFPKQNKFAVHLLLIQAMFFLLLRTFL